MPGREDVSNIIHPLRLSAIAISISALLLASCARPAPVILPTPTRRGNGEEVGSKPTPHAPEIRFALISEPTDVNVWALFDESGASYANYAVRWEYWPRLYSLSIPDRQFVPMAAEGMPSPVTQENDFFMATVNLRRGLTWTDNSTFTAEDVAFTVNTVLAFELGFDWKSYYNPDFLSRAEAIDSSTIKFYFKKSPNVPNWQYGALQGPILQKTYWAPRIIAASALLPDDAMRAEIIETETRQAALQKEVDGLNAQNLAMQASGGQSRQLPQELKRKQGDLDEATNSLAELNDEYKAKMTSARQALYLLNDDREPTLGAWMPADEENGAWVNKVNPAFPFEHPNFDRSTYRIYSDEAAAVTALEDNEVDMILNPDGIIPPATHSSSAITIAANINSSVRFLAFNSANSFLADPAIRQALACMHWSNSRPFPSSQFMGVVLPGNDFWRNSHTIVPCVELLEQNRDLKINRAVKILTSAGYSWLVEPAKQISGEGLVMPNGQPFPPVVLLSPSIQDDQSQALEAGTIENQAKLLGIPMSVEYVNPQDIHYRVFSSKNYDLAILGWRLGAYPDYLCSWFGEHGPFDYGSNRLKSQCEALEHDTDLDSASRYVDMIQSIILEDLPFIPLYTGITYDAYRNLRYPFEDVLNGLNGVYGAPSLAVPEP